MQRRSDELRERADVDDFRAAQELIYLLRQEGPLEELRDEVDAGTDGAGAELINLLSVVGEGEQAERICSFGFNPDGSIADGDPASHQTLRGTRRCIGARQPKPAGCLLTLRRNLATDLTAHSLRAIVWRIRGEVQQI